MRRIELCVVRISFANHHSRPDDCRRIGIAMVEQYAVANLDRIAEEISCLIVSHAIPTGFLLSLQIMNAEDLGFRFEEPVLTFHRLSFHGMSSLRADQGQLCVCAVFGYFPVRNALQEKYTHRHSIPTSPLIRTLLFDLGNVLLHFDHRLLRRAFPFVNGAGEHFNALMMEYERGEKSTEQFLADVHDISGIQDREVLCRAWCDIFWPNDSLITLLPALSKSHTLVMLSNTNQLHIEYARTRFPQVFTPFHHCVFSYETGLTKPDEGIYRAALNLSNTLPDECLFFDDIAGHVEGARAVGMHAFQYTSVKAIKDILALYDIELPSST